MNCRVDIGLAEALDQTLARLAPLPPVEVPVTHAGGLVPARDVLATSDCPTTAASTKDGFAVLAADLAAASESRPVRLRITDSVAAGSSTRGRVASGTCVRIFSGAPLPEGADAVLPVEFTRQEGEFAICGRDTTPGRNVQPRGREVSRGDLVASAGSPLSPARVGLLAAAGCDRVRVHPRPRVAIVATGDEVVAPGEPLADGQVFASNAVTLLAWLHHFGMEGRFAVTGDRPTGIRRALEEALANADALVTSGGAWTSERDLLTSVVRGMGAELIFHRVRIGPGKALAFGLLESRPLFCLAGGPASNEMGFLQIALPGLLHLSGRATRPFPRHRIPVTADLGGDRDWTRFFHARLERRDGCPVAVPLRHDSRLHNLAGAEAIVRVPEGIEHVAAGEAADTEILFPGAAQPMLRSRP